jgi:hypothetical protein
MNTNYAHYVKNKLLSLSILATTLAAGLPCVSYAQSSHYKGFVDLGYSFGHGDYGSDQIFVTTTHGATILSDKLFVGAGVGFGVSTGTNVDKTYTVPVYAASRYTFNQRAVKPFVDLKIGYAGMSNEEKDGGGDITGGFYLAPSFGISTSAGRVDFNVSLGYSVIRAKYEAFLEPDIESSLRTLNERYNAGGVFLTLGVSF